MSIELVIIAILIGCVFGISIFAIKSSSIVGFLYIDEDSPNRDIYLQLCVDVDELKKHEYVNLKVEELKIRNKNIS